MFYFGGMTLGYLTPPVQKTGPKSGENVANERREEAVANRGEPKPDGGSLVARANGFGLHS